MLTRLRLGFALEVLRLAPIEVEWLSLLASPAYSAIEHLKLYVRSSATSNPIDALTAFSNGLATMKAIQSLEFTITATPQLKYLTWTSLSLAN